MFNPIFFYLHSRIRWASIVTLFLAALVAHLILANSFLGMLMLLLGFAMICVIIKPEVYIVLFLMVRASVDLVADERIGGFFNVASFITLVFVFVGSLILFKKKNIVRIRNNQFLLRINLIFICLLLFSVPSFFYTNSFLISFADWIRLLSVLVIFNYSFLFFSDSSDLKNLFFIFVVSATIPLFLGLHQYLFNFGNQPAIGFNRIYGTFLHPNVFAQYLVVILLTTLYFFKSGNLRGFYKTLVSLFIALVVFQMCNTFTRNAWIAAAVSVLIFSLAHKKISRKLFYLIAIFIGILIMLPNLQARFSDLTAHRPYELNSLEWRFLAWRSTLPEIWSHWVFGHGLGMYEETFSFMAHNDYLRLLYEVGAVGLIFYLAIIVSILFNAFRNFVISRTSYDRTRYITVICLAVSWLIMGLTDNLARSTVVLIYLFCVLGALLGKSGAMINENTQGQ